MEILGVLKLRYVDLWIELYFNVFENVLRRRHPEASPKTAKVVWGSKRLRIRVTIM